MRGTVAAVGLAHGRPQRELSSKEHRTRIPRSWRGRTPVSCACGEHRISEVTRTVAPDYVQSGTSVNWTVSPSVRESQRDREGNEGLEGHASLPSPGLRPPIEPFLRRRAPTHLSKSGKERPPGVFPCLTRCVPIDVLVQRGLRRFRDANNDPTDRVDPFPR